MKKARFRERNKVIRVQPYDRYVFLNVSNNIMEAWKRSRASKITSKAPSSGTVAFVFIKPDTPVFAFLPEKLSLGAIAHEMFHAVNFILRDAGVDFEEEVWAYHLEDLTQKAAEFVHAKARK